MIRLNNDDWSTEEAAKIDLTDQQHVLVQLAENALTVAESLRDNYFANTAKFVSSLRKAMQRPRPSWLLMRWLIPPGTQFATRW